ncbi:hypothetical protein XA68_15019 [Ophiocordyceps unilateralis]|uniref:Polyprenal reductase n=1 Tax=Ophiocordyceps unilateralis TaxID=268505 RepID=A0A2A9P8Z2_OPHUN|nr:hypothetical protein XA68_15019 [Ophiocordyceps unilateralis]
MATHIAIEAIKPSQWFQTFFLATAVAIVAVHLLPRHFQQRLLQYGARGSDPVRRHGGTSLTSLLLDAHVPHAWFWHFYLVSVCWSAVWAWQYLTRGALMGALARAQNAPSTELGRVYLAWAMLAAQGCRRLFECFFVLRPGSSPMAWTHWLLGLVYYTLVNLIVWIHNSGAILASWTSPEPVVLLTPRGLLALPVFLAASLGQNHCHHHLANLPKYTLPCEGLFRRLICPHYTCECVIYLAIAFVSAPPGSLFNPSLLCVLAMVLANLGATARDTERWYEQKFGRDKVAGRWKMIPFIY